ncbi:hypothetical protein EQO05_12975 [Methanosarcina sp. MSH10X1]|uniref:UPF0228 family protein n=1 Tax=Methanosarcina sp. MSH10X1 TaxID=2507075 RepID=UPI000FFC3C0E|nr:UPF0228 family protein [Methanosarcina sp. MSH10X1]RXA17109.1 hypothetical protein EQO05_12975 [Methanosarcina sp. MSH10X1]
MIKNNKKNAVLVTFLILLLIGGLFLKTPADVKRPVRGQQVGGLLIEFEEGTSEKEVKAILENCNLGMYPLEYDVNYTADRFYIKVNTDERESVSDKFKELDVRNEFRRGKNWAEFVPDIKKGNYCIITVSEQLIHNESFLTILNKQDLELRKSTFCYIRFENGIENQTSENDASGMKNELELSESVLTVSYEYLEG